jgi:hypothetical protein
MTEEVGPRNWWWAFVSKGSKSKDTEETDERIFFIPMNHYLGIVLWHLSLSKKQWLYFLESLKELHLNYLSHLETKPGHFDCSWCLSKGPIPPIFLNFIFELPYINNMREFYCDNSIYLYSVPWTSSPLHYISHPPFFHPIYFWLINLFPGSILPFRIWAL